MELLWGHARLLLPVPSLSQKERQAEREGEREGLKKKDRARQERKNEKGWLFFPPSFPPTVDLINIHQRVFHNFKQEGNKPT